jgi:hypothetical protein
MTWLGQVIPLPRGGDMVEVVATAQPEVQPYVCTHAQTGSRLAPYSKNPSSIAKAALCRQTRGRRHMPELGQYGSVRGRSAMGVSTAIGFAKGWLI